MNKVLFNEGGQPIYLDDLSAIQDYGSDAVELLLSALGVDTDVTCFVKKPEVTRDGTSATFSDGSLWVAGIGLVPLVGVANLDLGITGRAYVRVTVSEAMPRIFQDGQERATRKTAVATVVNTSADGDYLYSEIPDMIGRLSLLIDKSDRTEYQAVEVEWRNGYGGVVEVKEIFGGYRYHVEARSNASSWEDVSHGNVICHGGFHPSVSGMFMTGGDAPARDSVHYLILSGEGYISLAGSNMGPLFAPIDITFDVLGNPWTSNV